MRAEHGAGRETACRRPDPVSSGGRAGSGWPGALEGPGDGRRHAGTHRCSHLLRSRSNTCDVPQRPEQGEVHVSLCYSPSLQRLHVVVLKARGLQPLTDAGMKPSTLPLRPCSWNTQRVCVCWAGVCVQVSLQIHAQVVKIKRSGVVKGEADPSFSHRMTFKLHSRHLDEACLRLELQSRSIHSAGKGNSLYLSVCMML